MALPHVNVVVVRYGALEVQLGHVHELVEGVVAIGREYQAHSNNKKIMQITFVIIIDKMNDFNDRLLCLLCLPFWLEELVDGGAQVLAVLVEKQASGKRNSKYQTKR